MVSRRHFIFSSVTMMGAVISGLSLVGPINKVDYDLASGEVILVKPGMKLNLPPNPQNGDSVVLIVRGQSANNPAIVKHKLSCIAGDPESLELDSMANVRLVYDAPMDNWKLV